jgi:hypothetical protein
MFDKLFTLMFVVLMFAAVGAAVYCLSEVNSINLIQVINK